MTQDRAERLAKQGYSHKNFFTKVQAKKYAQKLRQEGNEAVVIRDGINAPGRKMVFFEVWYRRVR